MKCLISGGAGFIGSHLTRRCVELGWKVDVVDDMSGSSCVVPGPGVREFICGDFACPKVLEAVRASEYDVVFHMAALARVSYSVEHPITTHVTNVERTLRLIEACSPANVRRFVFSSSSSVYGDTHQLPTPEDHTRRPRSPYALQKAVIEDYLRLYGELYGLESVCLRYFNVFGPGQTGSSPYSTAIAAWLTAVDHHRPLRSDGDGEQSRDMCYVDNVVDANIAAALHSGPLSAIPINIACGQTHTNNEILERIVRRYPDVQVLTAPARPGDVRVTHADITRMREVLGITPGVDLWEGLERTIAWHESLPGWRNHSDTPEVWCGTKPA